jgi:hypothetical protein
MAFDFKRHYDQSITGLWNISCKRRVTRPNACAEETVGMRQERFLRQPNIQQSREA